MINCIIVEDQAPAQRILEKYINATKMLSLAGTFVSVPDTLDFVAHNKVDLILLAWI